MHFGMIRKLPHDAPAPGLDCFKQKYFRPYGHNYVTKQIMLYGRIVGCNSNYVLWAVIRYGSERFVIGWNIIGAHNIDIHFHDLTCTLERLNEVGPMSLLLHEGPSDRTLVH